MRPESVGDDEPMSDTELPRGVAGSVVAIEAERFVEVALDFDDVRDVADETDIAGDDERGLGDERAETLRRASFEAMVLMAFVGPG